MSSPKQPSPEFLKWLASLTPDPEGHQCVDEGGGISVGDILDIPDDDKEPDERRR